jgi:hypothetical protein
MWRTFGNFASRTDAIFFDLPVSVSLACALFRRLSQDRTVALQKLRVQSLIPR